MSFISASYVCNGCEQCFTQTCSECDRYAGYALSLLDPSVQLLKLKMGYNMNSLSSVLPNEFWKNFLVRALAVHSKTLKALTLCNNSPREELEYLARALRENRIALRKLELFSFFPIELDLIFRALCSNTTLRELRIYDFFCNESTPELIRQLARANSTLKCIVIRNRDGKVAKLSDFARIGLQKLVYGNPLFERDLAELAELLPLCSKLKNLQLQLRLTKNGGTRLFRALASADSLTRLSVVWSFPQDHEVAAAASFFAQTSALRSLALSLCYENQSDHYKIIQALLRNTSLHTLEYTPVSDNLPMFCALIKKCTSLTELRTGPRLDAAGAKSLAKAVSCNPNLQSLRLSFLTLPDVFFRSLHSRSLISLDVSCSTIQKTSSRALGRLFSGCPLLRRLRFPCFIPEIAKLTRLTELAVTEHECCRLTALFASLESNSSLRRLKVFAASENDRVYELLREVISASVRLQKLSVTFMSGSKFKATLPRNVEKARLRSRPLPRCEPDVSVRVRGATFAAHRAVLFARSELLSRPDSDADPLRVDIDADPDCFGVLLDYWYTDQLDVRKVASRSEFLRCVDALSPQHAARIRWWLCHPKEPDVVESRMSADMRKLLESERFSDLELRAEGRRLRVHKAVLASRSEYFRTMFACGLKESKSAVVEIRSVSFETLKEIVEYLYAGELPLNVSDEFVRAADMFLCHEVFGAL